MNKLNYLIDKINFIKFQLVLSQNIKKDIFEIRNIQS